MTLLKGNNDNTNSQDTQHHAEHQDRRAQPALRPEQAADEDPHAQLGQGDGQVGPGGGEEGPEGSGGDESGHVGGGDDFVGCVEGGLEEGGAADIEHLYLGC